MSGPRGLSTGVGEQGVLLAAMCTGLSSVLLGSKWQDSAGNKHTWGDLWGLLSWLCPCGVDGAEMTICWFFVFVFGGGGGSPYPDVLRDYPWLYAQG